MRDTQALVDCKIIIILQNDRKTSLESWQMKSVLNQDSMESFT